MKRAWCAGVLLTASLLAGACAPGRSRPQAPAPSKPTARTTVPVSLRIGVTEDGTRRIITVRLEEYVAATILSELSPAAADAAVADRMFAVQAVIGRTYAVAHLNRHAADGFDLCATTHCQLYNPARLKTSRWAAAAREAVQATSGAILTFNAQPVRALFHADCGGHTSDASAVWGGERRPYLTSVADDGPASRAHAAWTFDATREQLMRALNSDPRTRVGRSLDGIDVLERDAGGRATVLALRGERDTAVRAEIARDVLSKILGARSIRSTAFEIQKQANAYRFTGRGFGHGVGLCQAGAFARIRAGATTGEVLKKYFPGASMSSRTPRG